MQGLGSKLRESGQALANVFSNPGLRRVQLAFVGSIVGDWAYAIAVAVYAYDQGGPAAVGLLGVVRYLSMALVLPLASTLADGGALVMPILIETLGIRAALAVLGGAVTGIVLLALAGLRRIDVTALAPVGLELVRKISIFRALPEPILERLARAMTPVEAKEADVIIREGDEGDLFYAIEEGTVVVSKEGRQVAQLGPGDYFGEIAML
jgi:Cyclic nucleotide-binding domain